MQIAHSYHLVEGDDQLVVGRSSEDLDVDTGAGDDSALFWEPFFVWG